MPETCTVRLKALSGRPLADPKVRDVVISSLQALAERNNLPILGIEPSDRDLTLSLACDKLTALGLLAELRRTTNAWYQAKYQSGPLWGTAPDHPEP